ncbi:unnamed protein product [Adineta steineri]|uniref:Uncharacterized protein n=1 Tax=Adineta steineri TaxID=433720 RepID=A0A819CZY8_9BILA|nr:unnamed protein product [Adineta steineri]CAF3827360.1 unnamed protein product [Adineta steineri]
MLSQQQQQSSNDELNTHSIAEQIIDNKQEQKLKRIVPTNEEKLLTSNIADQQTEKALIIPSTTKRYQSSKVKTNSSRTMGTK